MCVYMFEIYYTFFRSVRWKYNGIEDILNFVSGFKPILFETIKQYMRTHRSCKYCVNVKVGFTRTDESSIYTQFRLPNQTLLMIEDFDTQIQELQATLCKRVEDFNERGSGNFLSHIGECGVLLSNYNPTGTKYNS